MIRITKPEDQIPDTLLADGTQRTESVTTVFNSDPDNYLSGGKKLPVADNQIYGDSSVKDLLMTIQNGKCCYCERSRDQVELDIEHYRPKGLVKQSHNERAKIYPGYYWLAYDWGNLYLSCKRCNTSWKQNYFPLVNKQERSRWENDPNLVENEVTLLVNPSDDGRRHIRFNNDAPYAISDEGKTTIEELGLLVRTELREARLTVLKHLKRDLDIMNAYKSAELSEDPNVVEFMRNHFDIEEAQENLEKAVLPSAVFSSMAQDFLREYFENS